MDLAEQCFLLWVFGAVCEVFAVLASTSAAGAMVLAPIMCLSGLVFAYSSATGYSIWDWEPGSYKWDLMLIKWAGVCVAGLMPFLVPRLSRTPVTEGYLNLMGVWMLIILALNIVWTFLWGFEGLPRCLNALGGAMLVLRLLWLTWSFRREGKPFVRMSKDGKVFLFSNTPLSWVAQYSVWNIAFVLAEGWIVPVQHDLYFWAAMLGLRSVTGCEGRLEEYFLMARAVTLSTWLVAVWLPGVGAPPSGSVVSPNPPLVNYVVCCNLVYILMSFGGDLQRAPLREQEGPRHEAERTALAAA